MLSRTQQYTESLNDISRTSSGLTRMPECCQGAARVWGGWTVEEKVLVPMLDKELVGIRSFESHIGAILEKNHTHWS